MKQKLSPEASGTLAALGHRHRIKSFSPECAEELVLRGFAVHKGHHLSITDKGRRAAADLYATGNLAIPAATQQTDQQPAHPTA